ncbi:MAG: biliverdin-producing heme oxygenase [Planctomycetota bacterium]|nr:biliverdin-producing heme oxygenase [Planctomycetota bacterium]
MGWSLPRRTPEQQGTGAEHGASSAEAKPAPKCPFARLFGSRGASSLADELKARTREAHDRAERHPVQARMVRGTLSPAEYAAWLVQMRAIWRELDPTLAGLARVDPRVAAVFRAYHPHAHRVDEDLEFLATTMGVSVPSIAVTPAARALAGHIAHAAGDPSRRVGVLGVWYVLEGSANGGRFIAKALTTAFGWTDGAGVRSMDPHGDQQRLRWQQWRADIDAQAWSADERALILERANAMFEAVHEAMEEMGASVSVGEVM